MVSFFEKLLVLVILIIINNSLCLLYWPIPKRVEHVLGLHLLQLLSISLFEVSSIDIDRSLLLQIRLRAIGHNGILLRCDPHVLVRGT